MTAIFGLVLTIYYEAPWWVYLIGFFCLCLDADGKPTLYIKKTIRVEKEK